METNLVTAWSVKQASFLASKGAKEIIGTNKMLKDLDMDNIINLYNLLDKVTFLNDKNEVRNDVLKAYLIEELRKQGPTLHVSVPTKTTSWGETTLNYKGWLCKLLTVQDMIFNKEEIEYSRRVWSEDFASVSLEDAEYIEYDRNGEPMAMKDSKFISYKIKEEFRNFVIETKQYEAVVKGKAYVNKKKGTVIYASPIMDKCHLTFLIDNKLYSKDIAKQEAIRDKALLELEMDQYNIDSDKYFATHTFFEGFPYNNYQKLCKMIGTKDLSEVYNKLIGLLNLKKSSYKSIDSVLDYIDDTRENNPKLLLVLDNKELCTMIYNLYNDSPIDDEVFGDENYMNDYYENNRDVLDDGFEDFEELNDVD